MNKKAKHKVIKVRHLTESTFALQIERSGFEFTPGQCVNIGLAKEGVNREYSSYSSINDKTKMEFLIKAVDGGKVSSALQKLKPGNYVQLDGAYGKFTIKNIDDTKQPFVFIASGTGIAPFHSFALSYPNLNYSVLHGIRYINERYDEKDYKKGCYIPCISREKTDKYFSGRVSDYLRKNPPTPKAVYYLCGNTDMINEVYDILRENDVSGDRIFTEVFF